MLNLVANSIQQASQNPIPLATYSEDGSVWHHMSDALHQSLYRVLTLLIAVLPGILAFFVALVIFAVAGGVISWILRHCLTWAKFDLRIARKGGTDWSPASSPTEIVARVSFWVCVLLGLVIGVSAFDASYATGTALPISLLPYLTHAVGAALLLIAGVLIARFLAALRADQRRQCAIAVRPFSFTWGEVGARPHRGDGARSSASWREHC